MKGKVAFVFGAAVGYVLGTRAGRARYEQIKRGAQRVWKTPPVQRGADAVRGLAQAQVNKLKDAAVQAGTNLLSGAGKQATQAPETPAPSAGPAATTRPGDSQ